MKYPIIKMAWIAKNLSHGNYEEEIFFAKNRYHATIMLKQRNDGTYEITRSRDNDIILVDKQEMIRNKFQRITREEERAEKRKRKLRAYEAHEQFYVQNGYVGNSILFWAKNSQGYTTNIKNAQKFTKREIMERFINARPEDIIWSATHIEKHIKQHVDSQDLDGDFAL